jgi:hypothetical protein
LTVFSAGAAPTVDVNRQLDVGGRSTMETMLAVLVPAVVLVMLGALAAAFGADSRRQIEDTHTHGR